MPTPGSAPDRPDVSRERAGSPNERVGGRAVLGGRDGIDLGDDQAGQPVASGKDGQVGHRLVEGQARLVLGDARHRQVEKVDHIDVEVEEEPVGRGAHPGQRLLGGLPGAAADLIDRHPRQVAGDDHVRWTPFSIPGHLHDGPGVPTIPAARSLGSTVRAAAGDLVTTEGLENTSVSR